ncbi:MAG: hypothetical protein N3D09_02650 [Archaeoglobaceae archaeon]|nr:hypothetical protein [Archaeoglobaceae archaeon]
MSITAFLRDKKTEFRGEKIEYLQNSIFFGLPSGRNCVLMDLVVTKGVGEDL